jgi:hypothetical protein
MARSGTARLSMVSQDGPSALSVCSRARLTARGASRASNAARIAWFGAQRGTELAIALTPQETITLLGNGVAGLARPCKRFLQSPVGCAGDDFGLDQRAEAAGLLDLLARHMRHRVGMKVRICDGPCRSSQGKASRSVIRSVLKGCAGPSGSWVESTWP